MQHVANIRDVYGLPCVVAVNAFITDTAAELELVERRCHELGVEAVRTEVWAQGGEGGRKLADVVARLCDEPSELRYAYDLDASIEDKLEAIATRIYHASGIDLVGPSARQVRQLEEQGFGGLPICMAKTQYSFSDDPARLGAPRDWRLGVRNLKVSAGAGFVVALTGDIMTMPGLPRVPAAERIDVTDDGRIVGLF